MRGPGRPGGARRGDFGRGIADLARPDAPRRSPDWWRRAFRPRRAAPRPARLRQAGGASCSIASPIRRIGCNLVLERAASRRARRSPTRSPRPRRYASSRARRRDQYGCDRQSRSRPSSSLGERAERLGRIGLARRDRGRRASRRRCGRSAASRVASALISAAASSPIIRRRPRSRAAGASPRPAPASNRLAPLGEQVGQLRRFGDERQAAGELRQVPVDRLGLPAEGIEPVMVEISGGELRVPVGREAPRAVIEALAGDVDIVAVEHAVDEARGQVGGGERRGRAR